MAACVYSSHVFTSVLWLEFEIILKANCSE